MLQSIINFISSVVFAVLSTFGISSGTEQPKYQVIERLGSGIEIRQYGPRIAAETTIEIAKSENPRGDAFRAIAGYIFGANRQRQKIEMTAPVEVKAESAKIAMTAPVEVNRSDKRLMMRFFMPSKYTMETLPEPTNPQVKLITVPEITVAAITFSGSTDNSAVMAQSERLLSALKQTIWKISGTPTAYFYNPPWTMRLLRRNEVIVPVAR
jgi:effector-binding domain-containing protein